MGFCSGYFRSLIPIGVWGLACSSFSGGFLLALGAGCPARPSPPCRYQLPAWLLGLCGVSQPTPAHPSSARLRRLLGLQGPIELIRRSSETCVRATSVSTGLYWPALAQAWQSSPLWESLNLLGCDCRQCRELPGIGLRSAPPAAAGSAALLASCLGCL